MQLETKFIYFPIFSNVIINKREMKRIQSHRRSSIRIEKENSTNSPDP